PCRKADRTWRSARWRGGCQSRRAPYLFEFPSREFQVRGSRIRRRRSTRRQPAFIFDLQRMIIGGADSVGVRSTASEILKWYILLWIEAGRQQHALQIR